MHPLILNHREYMASVANFGSPVPQAFAKILEDILTRFLELHGDEIVPDHSRIMTSPTGTTDDGKQLEAKTRKLAARFYFDQGKTVDDVVADIYREFSEELKTIPEGKHFYPYQLIMSGGVVIDPVTFDPVIGFMTRYDIA